MKKVALITLGSLLGLYLLYIAFLYFVPYSEGTRAGELIKFSYRGVVIKTWEGEMSQGISGAQICSFSVLDKNEDVIAKLKEYQGNYIKVTYIERFASFAICGETNYFITDVELENSPHFNRK